ncbi:HD domain-containing protein [Allokutzneria sp. NRRL B-24872]|uniref:HD domain-containing protein n=1 Tax=Allokutzneria sp. NRRL B-24872 TaxID=1137961 RepID=UPI00143D0E71|nr:HD domain-containing protein [Allokutzneria sp. NRRL B-24872]
MVPEVVWGKERGLPDPYLLVAHGLDTAAAVNVLCRNYFADAVTDRLRLAGVDRRWLWATLVAAMHDIGKCGGFQGIDRETWERLYPGQQRPVAVDRGHTRPGQASMSVELRVPGLPVGDPGVWLLLGQIIGGHHGVIAAQDTVVTARRALAAAGSACACWANGRQAITDLLFAAIAPPDVPVELSTREWRRFALACCGVVPLADWIVSQTEFITARRADLPELWTPETARDFLATGIAAAEAELRRIGLTRPARPRLGFVERFGFAPRGVQTSLERRLRSLVSGPALVLVLERTGAGKTEAGWWACSVLEAAAGVSGMFVGLPTMATADAAFRRVVADLDRTLSADAVAQLVHSMAAYTPELQELLSRSRKRVALAEIADAGLLSGCDGELTPAGLAVASEWMRGARRALFAPVCVGTVDQLLAMVVRSLHQPMRAVALSGKAVLVDEAHAYAPYMQTLLCRAVEWLGAFGTPVVLLSATLPTPIARALLEAYSRGARSWRDDHGITAADPDGAVELPYPGWVVYDSRSGTTTVEACPVPAAEQRTLPLALHSYPVGGQGFARRCLDLVAPLWEPGGTGCALIVANTVADTQQLAALVRHEAPPDCEVITLHARLPQNERGRRGVVVERLFGKDGTARPTRAVVIASPLVQEALDLDFDMVVTALAPLAMLLQRAGRCHRHDLSERVSLWPAPIVHVLAGHDEAGHLAEEFPYPHDQRMVTWRVLCGRTDTENTVIVNIPGDVQELVEQVYPRSEWLLDTDAALADAATASWAQEDAERAIATIAAIPAVGSLTGLEELTSPIDGDLELGTRLGVDNRRVLPVYDLDGTLYLDTAGHHPVPSAAGGRWRWEDVATLIGHTIPVANAAWLRDLPEPPQAWQEHPLLAHVRLLPCSRTADAVPFLPGVRARRAHGTGKRAAWVDDELGLILQPSPRRDRGRSSRKGQSR